MEGASGEANIAEDQVNEVAQVILRYSTPQTAPSSLFGFLTPGWEDVFDVELFRICEWKKVPFYNVDLETRGYTVTPTAHGRMLELATKGYSITMAARRLSVDIDPLSIGDVLAQHPFYNVSTAARGFSVTPSVTGRSLAIRATGIHIEVKATGILVGIDDNLEC